MNEQWEVYNKVTGVVVCVMKTYNEAIRFAALCQVEEEDRNGKGDFDVRRMKG